MQNVEALFHAYRDDVYRMAVSYTKSIQDAEDVCQSVFLKLMEQKRIIPGKEKAWLMQVTANRCKDMLRAKHREELPLTEDISYLPKEESQVLEAVLSLEETYRIPIHLHYYEGYSLKEIGKLLGVPSGTVGSWLSRGREQLKRMLGGNEYGK